MQSIFSLRGTVVTLLGGAQCLEPVSSLAVLSLQSSRPRTSYGMICSRAMNQRVLVAEVGFGAAVLTNIIECVQNVFSKRLHSFVEFSGSCEGLFKFVVKQMRLRPPRA